MTPVIQATGLGKHFTAGSRLAPGGRRMLHALDHVSLSVMPGETLGIVGESGCGKSTLARCLLRLHNLDTGTVSLQGTDITHLSERALRPLRPRMQMIFQDPHACLNPRRRIGDLLAEPLRVHTTWHHTRIAARVADLLDLVALPRAAANRYPHEFSGGQRQRIGIARAIALHPALVVADEPVSALDVSVQAQIVNLLMDLRDNMGLALIFIAHDIAVVRQIANRIAVMYLGTIIETGNAEQVLAHPRHWYTSALLAAVPQIGTNPPNQTPLAGETPSPLTPPSGCHFQPRCPHAAPRCTHERPMLREQSSGHAVACHFPREQESREQA